MKTNFYTLLFLLIFSFFPILHQEKISKYGLEKGCFSLLNVPSTVLFVYHGPSMRLKPTAAARELGCDGDKR